jgi:thiamine biosynthesis lipoprotein
MGMPITVRVAEELDSSVFDNIFDYFRRIDEVYSPYKATSEVSQINDGLLQEIDYSPDMKAILALATDTTRLSDGFFNVWYRGTFDPSGIVKGWAIQNASSELAKKTNHFFIDAGGDIQTAGFSENGQPWSIGIRNPFVHDQNISIVHLKDMAVATSGTSIRGEHIYNPITNEFQTELISLSVIGERICDADRLATAAFAMGMSGMDFIARQEGYEAYGVTTARTVLMTNGWSNFEK